MKAFHFLDGTSAIILSTTEDLKIVGVVATCATDPTAFAMSEVQLQIGNSVVTQQLPQSQAVGTTPIVLTGPFVSLLFGSYGASVYIPLKETLKKGIPIAYNIGSNCAATIYCE